MINKTDIIEKLTRCPVPHEVLNMRKHILDSFKNLEFIEEGHKYYLHNPDGTIIDVPSVSSLIKEFEPYVDWDAKAANKALKEGVPVEVIKRKWKENALRGTNPGNIHHLYGENLMKLIINPDNEIDATLKPQYEDGYLIPCAPKQEAIMKYWKDIMAIDEIYPLLPEVKMYMPTDNKFGIKKLYCGTADLTFAIKYKGEWSIILMDYKTNYTLTNSFARDTGQYMLPPFDDLIDESLSHYIFQLSAYSLMLMNLGYKVIDRKLIWLKNDGDYEKIQLPDITQRLIDIYK